MHPLVKSTLLPFIRLKFRSIVNDDFVGLHSLSTNPIKSVFPKPSKTGTFSFRLIGRKRLYKLYGCINCDFANEACLATKRLNENNVFMPNILARRGRYILAEWIEGEDIRNLLSHEWGPLHESMVRYQAAIHNTTLPGRACSSVSYLRDFLFPRFQRYASSLATEKEIYQVSSFLDEAEPSLLEYSPRISHPDFTHFNIVQNDNSLYVVDNETLHLNCLWPLDIINTANIVFAPLQLKETYLESYLRYSDASSFLDEYSGLWEVVWLIRTAGSKLQQRDLEGGRICLTKLMNIVSNINANHNQRWH